MLTIYRKQIQKTWLFWALPTALLVAMALLVLYIWPDYEPILEQFQTMLQNNPLLSGILGESDIGSFEGFVGVELFMVGDLVFMGLILLLGTAVIAREADSGTLDVFLSYPVPRWQFLLEKLLSIVTLSLVYPIIVWGVVTLGAENLGVEFNNGAFLIALLGKWLVYMAFTCITILCSVIFMDTTKTLGSAGLIIGASWIFERFGGLIRQANEEAADLIQGISLFHYLEGGSIMKLLMAEAEFPLNELGVVLTVGIGALILALLLFRRREFSYK